MSKDPRADVVKKALTDPAFKAELLKNPKAAVEKATGVTIPSGVTVKVVEDGPSVVHLVLPSSARAQALTENELGKVAGGQWTPPPQPSADHCVDNTAGKCY